MDRIFGMSVASVYPLYVAKAEKKGRTRAEVDEIIEWLTGFDDAALAEAIDEAGDYTLDAVERDDRER